MIKLLVLGGAGFIGRHTLAALTTLQASAREGEFEVTIASRHPARIDDRIPAKARTWPRTTVRMEDMLTPQAWRPLLDGKTAVLNCVGILRQRGAETYDKVQHRAPAALAAACAHLSASGEDGPRLVHVSALGLRPPARSRFLTSKLAGEEAIVASGANWVIARPSLIDGPDGFGARWLRGVARLPLFVSPAAARGKIAAIHIEDLAAALASLSTASDEALDIASSREFELGGQTPYTFAEYIHALGRVSRAAPARNVRVPSSLARLGAHLCDLLHFSPFSFGHWELLHRDNVARPNRLHELLCAPPRQVPARDFGGNEFSRTR